MSKRGRPTYLQTSCFDDFERNIAEMQLYWTVEDAECSKAPGFRFVKHFLLRFDTVTARKRFIRECGNGHMLGRNTMVVKYAIWKDVPYFHITKMPDPEKMTEECIIFPNISSLCYHSPRTFDELERLYKQFGANPREATILKKSSIVKMMKAARQKNTDHSEETEGSEGVGLHETQVDRKNEESEGTEKV